MSKSTEEAKGCAKIGCFIDIIGGLLMFYGFIIQFGDSSTFLERFQYLLTGFLIICLGVAINIIGGAWFVGSATGEAVGTIIEYTVNRIIDIFTVKEEIKLRCPNALKAQILEKKKNAVNVGIFNVKSEMSQKISIKSDQGVSDSIRVGQVIYLNN